MDPIVIKAEEDIFGLLQQSKQIGWLKMNANTIQRIMYLLQVLYSFKYDGENVFGEYHFTPSIYGPYSSEIDRGIADAQSFERIREENGGLVFSGDDAYVTKDPVKLSWMKSLFLILGRYGEKNVFALTLQDPTYQQAVMSNSTRTLEAYIRTNETITKLHEFKTYFENKIGDKVSLSDEEYLALYFEYIFSQIIK